MALANTTVFESNTSATAANVNGGGFNPSNANGLTNGSLTSATGNSPVLSTASYTFVASDVNAWVYFPTQTNMIAGYYQISSVSAGAATLSAAIGQAGIVTNGNWGTNSGAGCATTASPTGVTFLVDYSRMTSARLALTDLASVGSSINLTSVTGGFTPVMVGNLIHQTTTGTGGFGLAQWFEIVSWSSSNQVATDRTTNNGTAEVGVTGKVGGALSLGDSSDNTVFQLGNASSSAAMRFFVKAGSYSIGAALSSLTAGNVSQPIIVEGYNATRGDRPTAQASQPKWTMAANAITWANYWETFCLNITGTAATMVTMGTGDTAIDCFYQNTSMTANRVAILVSTGSSLIACDAQSYAGIAVSINSASANVTNCRIHDSNVGLKYSSSGSCITGNIFEGNIADAINSTSAVTNACLIQNNTFYGAENKLGVGLNILTGSGPFHIMNNIFYGLSTGISHPDTNTAGYGDYNDFYNNTNDVSAAGQWQKGAHDIAVNPSFTSVGTVTGTTGKFAAGNSILIDTSQNFTTAGVVAGRDYLYISGGTGVTNASVCVGIASISTTTNPNDTLNLDTAQGTNTTADKTYQINIGHNFLPTGAI